MANTAEAPTVYTGDGDGGGYGWPVVACPEYLGDEP